MPSKLEVLQDREDQLSKEVGIMIVNDLALKKSKELVHDIFLDSLRLLLIKH